MTENAREEQIAGLLEGEHVKYQSIDLGEGGTTGGHDRTSMDDVLFSSDLSGLSLLDIGSSLGHFCIEAMKHGAAAATGLETSPERLRHARKIAALIDPRIEYVSADFERWDATPRSFDVVLCLNVLHHLYDPIAAIRKIMELTKNRFYLEVAPVNLREVRKVSRILGMWDASNAPLVLLGKPKNSMRAADRTFMFTKDAIRTIVNEHSKAFEPVLFHPSTFKDRWIVEARRRKIEHLVVVAGVTSVGKSSFIERLAEPELQARFGIDKDFTTVNATQLDKLRTGTHSTLVYHYDMLRPFDRPLHSYGRDPAFHLLGSANRVTLITLANDGEELRRRIQSPSARPSRKSEQKRHEVIHNQYGNPEFLRDWYEAWFEATSSYVSRPADKSFLVRSDDLYSEIPDRESLARLLKGSN